MGGTERGADRGPAGRMIRVRKPADGPAVLTDPERPNRGPGRTAELIRRAEAGAATFAFYRSTYAAKAVKNALIRAQHGKCCFCETQVTTASHGDVEHLRPKAGWDQEDGAGLQRPGYYWLAYEWKNLYLACEVCNQSFKGNRFPLADPVARARSHRDDPAAEAPLLIDPGTEDPEEFIDWRAGRPVPRAGSERAAATIRIVGLDRRPLNETRAAHLETLRGWQAVREALRPREAIEELSDLEREALRLAEDFLAAAVRDDAVYAAMARAELGR